MEGQYQVGVSKCIDIVRAKLQEFGVDHVLETSRFVAEVHKVLSSSMIPELSDLIADYAVLITKQDAVDIYEFPVYWPSIRGWMRNLAVVAVALNDLELFRLVPNSLVFVEMGEKEGVEGFELFRDMPISAPPRIRYGQLLTNLMCYQGNGGDSKWITEFFRDETYMVTGTKYMAAGSGPVSAIKSNYRKWNYFMKLESLHKMADCGKKNRDVVLCLEELAKDHAFSTRSGKN